MKYIKHVDNSEAFIRIIGKIKHDGGHVSFKGYWMIQGQTSYWFASKEPEEFVLGFQKWCGFRKYKPQHAPK